MQQPESPRRRALHYMREWRIARDLTQDELAQALGTSKSMVSRYENGETGMTFKLQLKVMQVLNVLPTEFFLPPPLDCDNPTRLRQRISFFKKKSKDNTDESEPVD